MLLLFIMLLAFVSVALWLWIEDGGKACGCLPAIIVFASVWGVLLILLVASIDAD